jgi:RNA polymerase sigma factor (sigma-70 family)
VGVSANQPTSAEALVDGASDVDVVYRAQWAGLVRLGRLLTGSQQLGEEVAQDAFLGLLRATRPIESPSAYLRRSVVNLAINAGKRRSREVAYLRRQREEVAAPPEFDETWQALVALPPRQRAVLVLRYYEDLSEQEIANVLGCRPGTVKSLASRALDHLREELS